MAGQMVGPTDSYQFLSPCLLSRSPASRMCDSEEGRDGQRCDSEEGRAWRWGGGEEGTDSAVAREGCRHRSGTSAAAEEAMQRRGRESAAVGRQRGRDRRRDGEGGMPSPLGYYCSRRLASFPVSPLSPSTRAHEPISRAHGFAAASFFPLVTVIAASWRTVPPSPSPERNSVIAAGERGRRGEDRGRRGEERRRSND